jgi:very-short-patch-repair endonuclease
MGGQATSADDRAKIEQACVGWKRRLVDLSRRNPLLFYQPGKRTALELKPPDPGVLRRLLSGKSVRLSELCADADDPARGRALHQKREENFEERGLSTLFLAVGLATWPVPDGGRPAAAPVVMVPVTSEKRRGRAAPIELTVAGDPHLNEVLRLQLEREHGIVLDEAAILADADGDGLLDADAVFGRLRAAVGGAIAGFAVEPATVLGNFSFQKLSMVRDLAALEELGRSDVVAALAGVAAARERLAGQGPPPEPRALDALPPSRDLAILDADSSQAQAVAAVLSGRSGVIQGPPGCGKSQTIANLIASLVADGKRVLFVAEKRAALDVVARRLDRAGLGAMVLDLAGVELTRRAVSRRIDAALDAVRTTPRTDLSAVDAELEARRQVLVDHERRLHLDRPPVGCSILELQGELLALRRAGRTPATRWSGPALAALTADTIARAQRDLTALASEAPLFHGDAPTPWLQARIERTDRLQQALTVVRGAPGRLREARARAAEAAAAARVVPPETLGAARALDGLLASLGGLLARYDGRLLAEDLPVRALALAPAGRGWFARLWAFLTSGAYRDALRSLRALARGETPTPAALLAAVREASDLLGRWRALATASAPPASPVDAAALGLALTRAETELAAAREVLPVDADPALGPLADAWDALAHSADLAQRVHAVQARVASLEAAGLGAYLAELRRARPDPAGWSDGLRAAWLASWVEATLLAEPELGRFDGRDHDTVAAAFRKVDRDRLALNAARVRALHAQRVVDARNAHRDQAAILGREAKKASQNHSLRTLAERAPDVLTALFPCWMASPLSVSQAVPAVAGFFDVVVFDEASQVLPEDAVAALLRGKAVVVAGDRHQLPPTTFFADRDPGDDPDGPDDGGGTAGFESLLDALGAFLDTWSLDWHYRSRDERLIAFSNQQVYGGRLVTFPSVGVASAVRHVHVPGPPGPGAGQERSASAEVLRVVELVQEHARSRPGETLGIITLGIEHQRRVEKAIEDALEADPALAAFWGRSDDGERPFVKNLERVQGDERDAILLTLGHAKDAAGRVMRFLGPILQEGGHRRLNVAITRARRRMTVVSSFTHLDLDPVEVQGRRGLELLRGYLEFAHHRGERAADAGVSGFPVNAFEADIQAALEARGLSIVPQLGVSRYRLDLAVRHPDQPGRFVLAVECDGASYHSAPTARDRDRLRQEHLEALGWRFCRIWSTDWFRRREEEIARVVEAYHLAVAAANADDAGSRTSGVAEPPPPPPLPPLAPPPPDRGPAPVTLPARPIGEIPDDQLDALARWVRADGLRRSDDEVAEEMFRALGYRRRGTRIREATLAAAARTRG